MPDLRFFTPAKDAFSLEEIAQISSCEIIGDSSKTIMSVAPLDRAGTDDLSFLDNIKYKEQFLDTKAGACFVQPEMVELAPKGVVLLVTPSPYKAYALAAQAIYPQQKQDGSIHASAVIGSGVEIGDGTIIEAGAVIGENVVIGQNCRIGPNAVISHAIIGDHVNIYPGAKIGQDGFGFAIDPSGYVKVPQLGRVVIESHVEIGANTCIDRGAGPDTVIGQGTWIDNLVQIGHNVKIGKGCVIVSQVGISGSTVVDDYVVMGGQVGVAGHLHIASGARIAAQSGIMRDIPAGQEMMGSPALPIKEYMRQVATLKRLIQKKKNG